VFQQFAYNPETWKDINMPACRVLTLAYAEWLCANRKTDPQAMKIVEGMKTFLLPTVNPDGFAAKMRGNRWLFLAIPTGVSPASVDFRPTSQSSPLRYSFLSK